MNLALQKRHEQLERWRQNEANVELIERQRQDELEKQRQPSKVRSPTVQRATTRTANRSIRNDKNKSISLSLDSESGLTESSQFIVGSTNHTNASARSTRTISNNNKTSLSERPRQEEQTRARGTSTSPSSSSFIPHVQEQEQHTRVKFTQSTLFLNACAQGDLDECRRMLDEKLVDINATTCDGLTGLHEAAICGNSQLVELLLDLGANINCCDHEGWTPLHAAASLGQAEIVSLLLEHQADVTIINCENFLAYDLARTDEVRSLIGDYMKEYDIESLRRQEELLIERDLERWLSTGKYEERSHPVTRATVLHVLAAKGYVQLMRRLLEANRSQQLKRQVNLEARDSEGFTPLLAASFWNQTEIVELLIEHGANILAQANSGYKISSIHLKNYQDSKYQQQQQQQQQQQTNPQERTTRSSRSSLGSSFESDGGQQLTTSTSQSDYTTTTRNRSTASLDSSGDNESVGDNIPSASARHLRSQQQQQLGQLSKSKSLEITTSTNQQQQQDEASGLLYSSMSVDRLLLRADSMGERDLRKSFKELVVENERLKQQLKGVDDKDKQRQQDWIRKERQLHRKISELEEENKQIEQWKLEIQRLKDENNSLIRVVSKLTKQNH